MKNLPISVCLLLLLALPSLSLAVDLIQTWQSALSHDPTIAAARAAQAAGQEAQAQGRAGLLPQAKLGGEAIRHRQENQNKAWQKEASRQFESTLGYNVSGSQVLYNAGAYMQYQQGKKSAAHANVQFIAAQQKLMLRVARAYFEILLASEHIKQIQAQKEAVTQQMKQAKKSFEVGVATITDFNEAQARYDEILAAEIAAQNTLTIKQDALWQIAPVDPVKLAGIDAQFTPAPPIPADLEAWLYKAGTQNPEIQGKTLALAIARDEIEKHRLLKSPTLTLEGGYGDKRHRLHFSDSQNERRKNDASIAVVLTVPLSTGGYRSAKLRESSQLAEQARHELEAITRQVQHNTKSAYLGVNSGVAQIHALRQALKSSQSLLDSTRLGQEVGIRTTIDILNAQQHYYATKYKLVEAKVNYMLSRLDLAASSGTLEERDLHTINQWLVAAD